MKIVVLPPPRPTLAPRDVAAVTEGLSTLASRDGRITPESFLELATPEVNPLHHLFEWDDNVAAREHRLHQARQIVRTVIYRKVRVEDEGRSVTVQVSRPQNLSPPAPTTESDRSAPPDRSEYIKVEVGAHLTSRQIVSRADAADDREKFLSEMAPMYDKLGRDLTAEDVARAAWDAGFARCEAKNHVGNGTTKRYLKMRD